MNIDAKRLAALGLPVLGMMATDCYGTIVNNSSEYLYVIPEDGTNWTTVPPGGTYASDDHDGFTTESMFEAGGGEGNWWKMSDLDDMATYNGGMSVSGEGSHHDYDSGYPEDRHAVVDLLGTYFDC